jgi:hypothetical protein
MSRHIVFSTGSNVCFIGFAARRQEKPNFRRQISDTMTHMQLYTTYAHGY